MQLKRQSVTERRSDTRKKIMLGGLFVKAGLDHFHPHDPATLYGMLLDAKSQMDNAPDIAKKWQHMGRELLNKETK